MFGLSGIGQLWECEWIIYVWHTRIYCAHIDLWAKRFLLSSVSFYFFARIRFCCIFHRKAIIKTVLLFVYVYALITFRKHLPLRINWVSITRERVKDHRLRLTIVLQIIIFFSVILWKKEKLSTKEIFQTIEWVT